MAKPVKNTFFTYLVINRALMSSLLSSAVSHFSRNSQSLLTITSQLIHSKRPNDVNNEIYKRAVYFEFNFVYFKLYALSRSAPSTLLFDKKETKIWCLFFKQ